MTYSVRNILIALFSAVAATVLVVLYTSSYQADVQQSQNEVKVWVAKQQIAEGTTFHDAQAAMTLQSVRRTDVVPGASVDLPKSIPATQVASATIAPGQQVLPTMFQATATASAGQLLKGDERGIRLVFDDASGLPTVIQAGDKVDLYVIYPDPVTKLTVGRLLAPGVTVLEAPVKVDATTATPGVASAGNSSSSGGSKMVMLEMTQQSVATVLALENTADVKLWLAARPTGAATDQPKVFGTLARGAIMGIQP